MLGLVLILGLLAFLAERLWPARPLRRVEGWWARVALLNLAQLGAVLLAGRFLDPFLAEHGLGLGLARLSTWAQGGLAYFASCLVYYAWHRARHESPLLWRWLHQTHHAPERLEVAMAFYKHPAEALANAAISSALVYFVLGCSSEGAAIYTLLAGGAELFYHLNLRTPRWLGLFVQRPEMHRVHHMRGHHAHNYADLPLIDMIFGTYWNPPEGFEVECGLEGEDRFEDLLLGRDLTEARDAAPARFLPRPLGTSL